MWIVLKMQLVIYVIQIVVMNAGGASAVVDIIIVYASNTNRLECTSAQNAGTIINVECSTI